jgi:hypothetical protein
MTDGNTCLRSIRSECPGGGSEPLNLKANKNMQVVRQSTELHPLRGWAWATSQPQLYVKVNSTESLPLSKSVTQTEDTELHVCPDRQAHLSSHGEWHSGVPVLMLRHL